MTQNHLSNTRQTNLTIADILAPKALGNSVFNVCNEYMRLCSEYDYVYESQIKIALRIKHHPVTVSRAFTYLVKMGVLKVFKKIYNGPNVVVRGPLFSSITFYESLASFFSRIPAYVYPIALLISVTSHTHANLIKSKEVKSSILSNSLYSSEDKTRKIPQKRVGDSTVSMIEVPYSEKIKKICDALCIRGESVTNSDFINITAFPIDALDYACKVMRESPDEKFPKSRFFEEARKYTVAVPGRKPDWERSEMLRNTGHVYYQMPKDRKSPVVKATTINGVPLEEYKPDRTWDTKRDWADPALEIKKTESAIKKISIEKKKKPIVIRDIDKEIKGWQDTIDNVTARPKDYYFAEETLKRARNEIEMLLKEKEQS